MTFHRIARPLALMALTIPLACGEGDPEFGSYVSGVAPAGSAASLVSETFPDNFAPGERLNVQFVMQNDGATPGTNDWNTNFYRLIRLSPQWNVGAVSVVPNVAVGAQATFNMVVTAPGAGPESFSTRMYHAASPNVGFFGDTVGEPVISIANAQRRWQCTFVSSTVPATMGTGQIATVSVTVQNTGTNTWNAGNHCLLRRDVPSTTWGAASCPNLNAAVAPGGTGTVTFNITAPATAGTYNFRRQMNQKGSVSGGSVGAFDLVNNCVDFQVTVGAPPANAYDAAFVPAQSNIDELVLMQTNEVAQVSVTYQNTGSQPWVANRVRLYTRNTPVNLWGYPTIINIANDVAAGGFYTFTFPITAPAIAGNYAHQWRVHGNAPAPGFFGEQINLPVTVSDVAPPQYDASVVATTIPGTMGVNQQTNFLVTMRNDGTADWTAASGIRIVSANAPNNLWGVAFVNLPGGVTVTPGNSYQWTIPVRAPSAQGAYQTQWVMNQNPAGGGVGNFGTASNNTVNVVQDCGDSVINPGIGEQCDDGNIADGDGCSSICQIETQRRDLLAGPADRTLVSPQAGRGMANSAIGDINNDGIGDLAVANWGGETVNGLVRGRAGVTYLHAGAANFFTNTAELANANSFARVIGPRTNYEIGGGAHGSVKMADVTGDGITDLILSGGRAACADGTTAECGRIYILAGGGLGTGLIDLATTPAPHTAVIVGIGAGDRARVISTGDLNNDGVADLVVGMSGAGGGRGEIAIIAGGGTLTGTITLAVGNRMATILGAGANDGLGISADVGQVGGTAPNDLLVGAGGHVSATGGDRAGGAWAIFGPLAGTYDLAVATDWNVRWRGAGIRDAMGADVRIGHVMGSAVTDVLISNEGFRAPGNIRYGSVDVYQGPVIDGSDFDLSTGALPTARIQGEDITDGFGHCIETVDLNGDLIEDILSVAWFSQGAANNLNQAGELAMVLGATALADQQISVATSPFILYEATSLARACQYRHSLSKGDLNGDGRPDFCVGSPGGGEPGFPAPAPGRVDCIRNPY